MVIYIVDHNCVVGYLYSGSTGWCLQFHNFSGLKQVVGRDQRRRDQLLIAKTQHHFREAPYNTSVLVLKFKAL